MTLAALPPSDSKSIIHLDLDSFYAQVEGVRLGLDPKVPLVVAQWNGILAVNYPAREFGIGRFDTIQDAKLKCADLVVQHVPTIASTTANVGSSSTTAVGSASTTADAGSASRSKSDGSSIGTIKTNIEAGKPAYHPNPNINTHKASLVTYREASSKIMAIINSHFPKSFQKASVDEAFIDCTEKVNGMIMDDYRAGLLNIAGSGDEELPLVDWSALQDSTYMISYEDDKTQSDPSTTLDDQKQTKQKQLEITRGWKDLQLYYASRISLQLRTQIHTQLGYTASTGIAHNKTLAKLVSSTNKPNKQTVLLESRVMDYMSHTKITDIRGLGGKLGDRILEEFAPCEVAADLWRVPLALLVEKLGRVDGEWTFDICRGICHDPVKQSSLTNSMQSCKNFKKGIGNVKELGMWLRNLSSELYYRVLQEWEDNKRWPRTISVSLRCSSSSSGFSADTSVNTKRPMWTKQSPFPHRDYICGPDDVYAVVEVIVLEVPRLVMPCWYIAIGLTGLTRVDMSMPLINTFFRVKEKDKEATSFVEVVDGEREIVCEEIRRVISPKSRKVLQDCNGSSGGSVADGAGEEEKKESGVMDVRELLKVIDQDTGLPLFFKCLECGDVFERRKMVEHGDYHLAASLARSGGADPFKGSSKKKGWFGSTSTKSAAGGVGKKSGLVKKERGCTIMKGKGIKKK